MSCSSLAMATKVRVRNRTNQPTYGRLLAGAAPQPPGAAGPLGGPPTSIQDLFMQLLLGRSGDAVHSQEALDRIITELMEQNPQSHAAPPATAQALAGLQRKKADEEMLKLDDDGEAPTCTICMEELEMGVEMIQLPCKHWYHEECATAWLKQHNTCPICRAPIDGGAASPQGAANPQGAGDATAANSAGRDRSARSMSPPRFSQFNTNRDRAGSPPGPPAIFWPFAARSDLTHSAPPPGMAPPLWGREPDGGPLPPLGSSRSPPSRRQPRSPEEARARLDAIQQAMARDLPPGSGTHGDYADRPMPSSRYTGPPPRNEPPMTSIFGSASPIPQEHRERERQRERQREHQQDGDRAADGGSAGRGGSGGGSGNGNGNGPLGWLRNQFSRSHGSGS